MTDLQVIGRTQCGRTQCAPTRVRSRLAQLSFNPLAGIDWSEVRSAYAVFIENPALGVFHIIAAARHSRWQRWVEKRLSRQAATLANASIAIDLGALQQLPVETLGGAYARHLTQQGFDPEAFVTPEDRDWVQQRLALSHDVYHVITGFDGTPTGEFGLAAFCLVQQHNLLNVFVLSFVPWTCLGFPKKTLGILKAVFQGLVMGLRCRAIFAYPFEDNWSRSLSQVRRDLKIALV